MRIAIYGGAFDPPTYGHKYVVQYLLDTKAADQVWVVPCNQHTFKKSMSESKIRVDMCVRMFTSMPNVVVRQDPVVYQLPSDTFSLMNHYQTIKHQNNKDDYFFFVVGSDNVHDMKNWINSDMLLASYPFTVVPRGNYKSSTDIRNDAAQGKLDACSTDPYVLDIIKDNHLYGYPGEPVWKGKHLQMMCRNDWEFVSRRQEVVSIVATDDHNRLILVRQRREPVNGMVIELPSGLVDPGEKPIDAAHRELLEETGYSCARNDYPTKTPFLRGIQICEVLPPMCKSPGLTDEKVIFFIFPDCQNERTVPEDGIEVILTSEPINFLRKAIQSGDNISSDVWLWANIYEEYHKW